MISSSAVVVASPHHWELGVVAEDNCAYPLVSVVPRRDVVIPDMVRMGGGGCLMVVVNMVVVRSIKLLMSCATCWLFCVVLCMVLCVVLCGVLCAAVLATCVSGNGGTTCR